MNRRLSGYVPRWNRFRLVCITVVLAITALIAATQAAEPAATSAGSTQTAKFAKKGGWEITIVPYIWVLSDTGSTTVKGREIDVDATPKEMVSKVKGALMLGIDVRQGRLGGFINTFYARIGDEGSAQVLFDDITIDTDIKMLLMGAAVYYRLGPYGLGKAPSKWGTPAVKVDPYIGGRYTDLDVKFNITTVNRLTGNTNISSFEDGKGWVDPIIGVRTTWDLFRHWNVIVSGDVGGFGVGSDFTWSATVLGGYRFNFSKHISGNVLFGYRALYQDYSEGSGNDRFEYKATMHGPVVGLAIGF